MTGLEKQAFEEIKFILRRMEMSTTIMNNYVHFSTEREKEMKLYYECLNTYETEKKNLNSLLKAFEE